MKAKGKINCGLLFFSPFIWVLFLNMGQRNKRRSGLHLSALEKELAVLLSVNQVFILRINECVK